MATQQEPARPQPTRVVHEIYEQSIQARSQWIQVATTPGANGLQSQAHWQLHQTALQYLEVMKHHLRTNQSMKEWWDGEPPSQWPREPPTEGSAFLEAVENHGVLSGEKLEAMQASDRFLIHEQEDISGPDEEPRYACSWTHYKYGLRHISEQWGEREPTQSTSVGYGGVNRSNGSQPERLRPEVLMRVMEALDEAADGMGLLTRAEEQKLPHDHL